MLTVVFLNMKLFVSSRSYDFVESASLTPVLYHQVKALQHENPLIVFSGDAFNPSLLSTVTMGAHMPPVLNAIGVHVAAVGNHDFDFGVSQLVQLTKSCNFPWLLANVLDKGSSASNQSQTDERNF